MTITYPLTLPVTPPTLIEWSALDVVAVSVSPFTFQQQAQEHVGQIWMARLILPPMDRDEGEQWIATLLALRGRLGTFHLGDPLATSPKGSGSGTPLVNGAGQTGQVLLTKGWTASAIDVLKAGDFIQLGSGLTRRIYRVLQDVDADGTGLAGIDIWPRLRESPADNEPLVLQNTKGTFRLAHNQRDWHLDIILIDGIELDIAEAL